MMAMQNVYIAAATRTAVGKAPRGTLRDYRPDDMAAAVLKEVVNRAGIQPDPSRRRQIDPTTDPWCMVRSQGQ